MGQRASLLSVAPALASLAFAIAVVISAWRAPDKGFQAFLGHTVVHVDPGGIADRAGLREGDVIVEVDGRKVTSTLDYAFRVLRRAPGEHVALGVRRDGSRLDIALELGPSPPPWSALVATLLATAMLVLGLGARIARPDDIDARRFYRTTLFYAALYAGALSWTRLIVHPVLGLGFLVALFIAPAAARDLSLDFPHRAFPSGSGRLWRRIAYTAAAILSAGVAVAVTGAILSYLRGGDDRALGWVVICVAAQISTIPILAAIGLVTQVRAHRVAQGSLRAQLRWVIFGHALSALPVLLSVPIAVVDFDKFLIVRYQPFVVAVAVLWSLGYGLAVLRIRLADVDALIRSSLGYAVTTGAAVLVYLGVVLA